MKYVDEFRDPQLLRNALDEIRSLVSSGRLYRIMEVCGGHTHSIFRFGLKELLPPEVELIHGPGCPVCVLPMGRIDDGLEPSPPSRPVDCSDYARSSTTFNVRLISCMVVVVN